MRRYDPAIRTAVLAAYDAGMSQKLAGQIHGVSESTVSGWVRAAGASRTYGETIRARRERKETEAADELALTGGRWVLDPVARVQRWVSATPVHRDMTDRKKRIEWEESQIDADQARILHARYFNGCREPRTVVGERIYQRLKKRAQAAKKRAA